MQQTVPLTTFDIAALLFFILLWAFYAAAVGGHVFSRPSLTVAMNKQRRQWIETMAKRELRMIDTSILSGLQTGTGFFASTSLFALGGCVALIGQSQQVLAVLNDIPFIHQPERGVFEIKTVGLSCLFAYSFFKFAWSYRLFNYCSILIGAVPPVADADLAPRAFNAAIERAARMNILAGKHFNAGLLGIFFSIGYLGWFIGPVIFASSSVLVVIVLLRRQFFSKARQTVLSDH
ncbi:DUF599 family protein [Tianweitania sp. BSSL-BM11]|uniref:DUF599 family protein n=1 Tax=Tianweitania aestuarii TaxID=2814886 RepID=A0ABS5RWB3_9HYPH|nr:DUF599 family protein [Tianweitania aestuarii]MBS9720479.1 DUF599 family protein [Tianweitania aestuarii]